jgi:hypothetical protein
MPSGVIAPPSTARAMSSARPSMVRANTSVPASSMTVGAE